MKKIDSWLDIQRYVREAASLSTAPTVSDVEVIAKSRERRRVRRFTRIKRITV